jgi:hypothetical protein
VDTLSTTEMHFGWKKDIPTSEVKIIFFIIFHHYKAARELESLDPSIIPGYEELGYLATGQRRWGKLAVSSIVMFHTFTCCCAYSFVIKKEIGPIIARLMNLFREMNDQIDLGALRSGTLCGVSFSPFTCMVLGYFSGICAGI